MALRLLPRLFRSRSALSAKSARYRSLSLSAVVSHERLGEILPPLESFAKRHIGPSRDDVREMLNVIGVQVFSKYSVQLEVVLKWGTHSVALFNSQYCCVFCFCLLFIIIIMSEYETHRLVQCHAFPLTHMYAHTAGLASPMLLLIVIADRLASILTINVCRLTRLTLTCGEGLVYIHVTNNTAVLCCNSYLQVLYVSTSGCA